MFPLVDEPLLAQMMLLEDDISESTAKNSKPWSNKAKAK